MAKIDRIGFDPQAPADPDQQTDIINVTATVGANGVNNPEDVIIVQALLKFALEPRPDYRGVRFPEPSGANVVTTAQIIKKYQRHQSRSGSRVSIDGRVDPLKGGIYAYGKKKMWTIYTLNLDAVETALLSGAGDPIKAICRRWSVVDRILNKNGVGTLGLELE